MKQIIWYIILLSNILLSLPQTTYGQHENQIKVIYLFLKGDIEHTINIDLPVIGLTWEEHTLLKKKKDLAKKIQNIFKKSIKKGAEQKTLNLLQEYDRIRNALEDSIKNRTIDQKNNPPIEEEKEKEKM